MGQDRKQRVFSTVPKPERAVLVAVKLRGGDGWGAEDSLEELEQLARAAGVEVVGRVVQKLPSPTHFYLGKGKLEELAALKGQLGYNVVITDDELSPVQQRNMERVLKVKIIDRSALILDIFAKRARTREGQLQVELAQHQYLMPRLIGQWTHLERLGGGIGTRGPGESQLETDRRLIRERIRRLKEELEEVRRHRTLYRKRRQRQGLPVVSLVGYTNAGKSTLFNALCQANVFVESKPFATLDPTTRRLKLPNGEVILLTDTVGFIHKLPPSVITAFRATLEELEEASLLLHVLDISHRNSWQQYETVEKTLHELGLGEKPRILVLNKVDLLPEGRRLKEEIPDTVFTSATLGWGLDKLSHLIATKLDYVKQLVRTI